MHPRLLSDHGMSPRSKNGAMNEVIRLGDDFVFGSLRARLRTGLRPATSKWRCQKRATSRPARRAPLLQPRVGLIDGLRVNISQRRREPQRRPQPSEADRPLADSSERKTLVRMRLLSAEGAMKLRLLLRALFVVVVFLAVAWAEWNGFL